MFLRISLLLAVLAVRLSNLPSSTTGARVAQVFRQNAPDYEAWAEIPQLYSDHAIPHYFP